MKPLVVTLYERNCAMNHSVFCSSFKDNELLWYLLSSSVCMESRKKAAMCSRGSHRSQNTCSSKVTVTETRKAKHTAPTLLCFRFCVYCFRFMIDIKFLSIIERVIANLRIQCRHPSALYQSARDMKKLVNPSFE